MKKHRNKGLQKICTCARKNWSTCAHAWHFSFQWNGGTKRKTGGQHYRFSLDSHFKRHIDSKSEAEDLAADLRKAIKAGTFGKETPKADMTVRQLADEYLERYVRVSRAARATVFQTTLSRILRTPIKHPTQGTKALGDWPLADVVSDTIERFREARLAGGTGVPGTNRLLSSLRALWTWGLRRGHATTTPFRWNGVAVVRLEKEHARSRRLGDGEEQGLLAASSAHLHAIVVAALETGMRRGEILSLQWVQVEGMVVEGHTVTWPGRATIFLPHEKTKTKADRRIPIDAPARDSRNASHRSGRASPSAGRLRLRHRRGDARRWL